MSGSATRAQWADFVDYNTDEDEVEEGGVVYYAVGSNRNNKPPSALWDAKVASVNSGVAKWSNFAYYKVNDVVFDTTSTGQQMFQCILANTNQPTGDATYWTALP